MLAIPSFPKAAKSWLKRYSYGKVWEWSAIGCIMHFVVFVAAQGPLAPSELEILG